MYFCCSQLVGGGCSPVGFTNRTACQAVCGDTERCDVRTVEDTTMAAPLVPQYGPPYGYPPLGLGAPVSTVTTTQVSTAPTGGVGVVPVPGAVGVSAAGAPLATEVAAAQQATQMVPAEARIATGTAATTVPGNQMR